MHPQRQRKLTVILTFMLLIGLGAGLILYALRQNISLFYTPSQIKAGVAPLAHKIRVGGMVVNGSIKRDPQSLAMTFQLSDNAQTITVEYEGVLPDLFREGQGIIAQGQIQDDLSFQATQVLAKHDENYMPPEVKASLKPQFVEKKSS